MLRTHTICNQYLLTWIDCSSLVNFPRPSARRRLRERSRRRSYKPRELHRGEISCLPSENMHLSFEMVASSISYRKVSCYLHREIPPQQQAQSDFGRYHREGLDKHLKCSHYISRTGLLTLVPICTTQLRPACP
jgi:hypothetical protein